MTTGGLKLNRIQRRAFLRQLQQIVYNMDENNEAGAGTHTIEERMDAAKTLIDLDPDTAIETFNTQLQRKSQKADEINRHIIKLMTDAFTQGLAEADAEE